LKVPNNQSTHLFEYNSHGGWLQKTHSHKFDIKIIKKIKNNQIMVEKVVGIGRFLRLKCSVGE